MSATKTKQHGKRRVSSTLPLILVTSATLSACSNDSADNGSQELATIRDQYQSLDDCRKDWGDGPACEAVASSSDLGTASIPGTIDNTSASNSGNSLAGTNSGSHFGGYGMTYFGPHYSSGYRDTVQRSFGLQSSGSDHAIGHSVSRGSVSRGGFGSTAHGHSGGG